MIYVNDPACNGCGECVDKCHSGALILQNNCAYIQQDLCQGCEACLEACSRGAIISGEMLSMTQELIHINEYDHAYNRITIAFYRAKTSIAQQKFVTGFGAPAQYF
jgi:MinD superfamily P-loop ATPase